MDLARYNQFIEQLVANLKTDSRVLGLIALGSMAQRSRMPDDWSDHDFFVITIPGEQENFRQNRAWLPDSDQIVLHIRETEHGLKVLYAYGHLIEFAVFDLDELNIAKVNDCRILLDQANIADHLNQTVQASASAPLDESRAFSLFLSLLLVGAGRAARGEILSAHRFIKDHALANLLPLLAAHLPADASAKARLDNLDAFRRFEIVFPDIAPQIHDILLLPPVIAAQHLLTFADQHLSAALPDYPTQAITVVRDYLAKVTDHTACQYTAFMERGKNSGACSIPEIGEG